ncbi:MAG: sterol desaturase family protein [Gammaproteobacteria bacterium]|nr:sterol desaturase family protein [Gammaproteobacteria bacterium]MCP5137687.1 sterol desaturase family protein [Gammaproteobacteria bacterium]
MSFDAWVLGHEPLIRLGVFFGVFLLMALWEWRSPRRVLSRSKVQRWGNNLGLLFTDILVVRLLFPAAAVGMALFAEAHGWGVLNLRDWPSALELVVALLVLDFAIWLQHVIFHAVPVLWRLHRVHHADPDYDVTTGSRFHPIEIVLSMLYKFAVIAVLGPSVVAVVLFEVILNGAAMFNHANVRLPLTVDRWLRWFIVTPDMHRVHHSVQDDETNSNFGFNLPWWDRLFGTYKAQPDAGHEAMTIGIDGFHRADQVTSWWGMMKLPFQGRAGDYAVNRRSWHQGDRGGSGS